MEKVIIKLGGSIITCRDRYCTTNYDNLERICQEVSAAVKEKEVMLFIIIGAGSYGHQIAHKHNLHKGYQDRNQLKALRLITSKMLESANIVANMFEKLNIPTYCFHTPSYLVSNNGTIEECFLKPIEYSRNCGIVPIMWGEINFDKYMKFTNVSGDKIAIHIAKYFSADRVLMFSDVDGVMKNFGDKNQKVIEKINEENFDSVIKQIQMSKKIDINGGMKIKLESMYKLLGYGIQGFIGNGNSEGLIYNALIGNKIKGTYIN